uniref:Uncharacterized protein n=1 Tax=Cajanus cajan TaxID=3821 RepID=A0A151R6D5_CAJCA|nr:hypothetical protein KK1_040640 [Cajanus cajan]
MQALGTIRAHKLQKFLDQASKGGMHDRFKSDDDKISSTISDAYALWDQQDQMIFT